MWRATLVAGLGLLGACHPRAPRVRTWAGDTGKVARLLPLRPDGTDSLLRQPRTVGDPAVVVFWLRAADTLAEADRASAFDDLRYYTAQVDSVLAANSILLLATRSDTLYVTLPNHTRRMILLSGLDYPFGYVFVDPGGPERILTGVYSDDDLLDELRAYFDFADDSTDVAVPRATT
jgi:hypothetical protein